MDPEDITRASQIKRSTTLAAASHKQLISKSIKDNDEEDFLSSGDETD